MDTYDQAEAESILARHAKYLLQVLGEQPSSAAYAAFQDIHLWLDDRNN